MDGFRRWALGSRQCQAEGARLWRRLPLLASCAGDSFERTAGAAIIDPNVGPPGATASRRAVTCSSQRDRANAVQRRRHRHPVGPDPGLRCGAGAATRLPRPAHRAGSRVGLRRDLRENAVLGRERGTVRAEPPPEGRPCMGRLHQRRDRDEHADIRLPARSGGRDQRVAAVPRRVFGRRRCGSRPQRPAVKAVRGSAGRRLPAGPPHPG